MLLNSTQGSYLHRPLNKSADVSTRLLPKRGHLRKWAGRVLITALRDADATQQSLVSLCVLEDCIRMTENIEAPDGATSERSISPLDLSGIGHAQPDGLIQSSTPTPAHFSGVTDLSLAIPFATYMQQYIQAVANFRVLGCILQRDSQFLTYAYIECRTLNITINSPNYTILGQALDSLLTILYVTQDYQVYSIQSLLVKKFLETWNRLMRCDLPISMSINVPCGLALLSRYLSMRAPDWVDSDQGPVMLKIVVFFSLLSHIDLPLRRVNPTRKLYIDVAKKAFEAISDAVFVTRMLDYHASIYLVLDTLLDHYFEVSDVALLEKLTDVAYRIVSKPFIDKIFLHRRSYASLPNCAADIDLIDYIISRAVQAIMRDRSIQGGGADEMPGLITNALRHHSDLDMEGVYAEILSHDRRVAAGFFCLGAFVWMTTNVRRVPDVMYEYERDILQYYLARQPEVYPEFYFWSLSSAIKMHFDTDVPLGVCSTTLQLILETIPQFSEIE